MTGNSTSKIPQTHGLSDGYAFKVLNDLEKEWLRQLPASFLVKENTLLFHGTPSSDSEYLLETVEHGRAALASRNEIKKRLGYEISSYAVRTLSCSKDCRD